MVGTRNRKDGNAGSLGYRLCEQLHPFIGQILGDAGEPRDIPARPSETGDEAVPNRIGEVRRDDGDGSGCLLEGADRRVAICEDHVNPELDQLSGERWHPVGSSLGPAVIDENVLALYVTELAEALPEGLEEECALSGGGGPQVPYPRDLR